LAVRFIIFRDKKAYTILISNLKEKDILVDLSAEGTEIKKVHKFRSCLLGYYVKMAG